MGRVGTVGNYGENIGIPEIPKLDLRKINVSERVSMLFSIDYLYMREYFNHIVRNFIEFGELENQFIVSFYRYLNMCSIPYMKHFLKDLDNLNILEPEFQKFLLELKNFIYSKINSRNHA